MKPEAQAGYFRRRVLKGLRIYFAHRRWPRLVMSGVLALAGFVMQQVAPDAKSVGGFVRQITAH